MSMLRTVVSQMVRYERIATTIAKAKAVRRLADNMVQLGKEGTLSSARLCSRDNVLHKLFPELAYRYKDRAGGYTGLLGTRLRVGDTAPMAYIKFIDREPISIRVLNQSTVHNLHRQKKRELPAGGCAVKWV